MRILLMSMPDSVDMIDNFVKLPNLAIVSLAGSLRKHEVRCMDLILFKPGIREAVQDVIDGFRPDIIGLSAMTFQFSTLLRIAWHIRNVYPGIRLAAGGYHATLMAEEISGHDREFPLDFLIRGEGEAAFSELADHLEGGIPSLAGIQGLSYRSDGVWHHNPARSLCDTGDLPLPDRSARVKDDYALLGMPIDVAETSRGCLHNCKFCSITRMYGKTFRRFPVERIVQDLVTIRRKGTRAVFFTDDNITFDPEHFGRICDAIIEEGLNDMVFVVQVSAAGIAKHPGLVGKMSAANFRIVFVGFESMVNTSLREMQKPTDPDINRKAASLLRNNGISVIAGIIAGYPDDTKGSIAESFRLLRELRPDGIYAQYLTPYPKTVLREEMLEAGLIVNPDDFSRYDGFSCNVRTRHLSQKGLYRALRKELLKSYFRLSLIRDNHMLKSYRGPFILAMVKSLVLRLTNLITSGERKRKADI